MTRVNWRATARRGELWVNDRHPERNTDVVLFLDAFTEARARRESSTLDLALRAAASLARAVHRHARPRRARQLRRLAPLAQARRPARRSSTGSARRCSTREILLSYAWRDIAVVPARVLPPQALVIALTPLLDERMLGALFDLRARGHDLMVIEASPEPYVEPGGRRKDQPRVPALEAACATRSATACAREAWRSSNGTRAIPLAVGIEEAGAFRRHAFAGRG